MRQRSLLIIGISIVVIALSYAAGQHDKPAANRLANQSNIGRQKTTNLTTPEATTQARLNDSYGKLPLNFEANKGQTDGRVKFISRGGGYTLFLASNEAVLQLRNAKRIKPGDKEKNHSHLQTQNTSHTTDSTSVLRMRFVGANAKAEVTGEEELAGQSNYFNGNDPQQWRTNVANFAKVRYREIYRGVDVVYYGNQRQLEYDFVISPHADPNIIALDLEGAKRIEVNAQDELILRTAAGGEVRQLKPYVYQDIAGERRVIDGRYVIRNKNRVGFEVDEYDKSKSLVIDPVLSYSTYLGGGNDTFGTSIAVDSSGSAYVTGITTSIDFPVVGPFQASPNHNNPGNLSVGFVTKLNPAGTAFVYSTYLGSPNTLPSGIKVDGAGSAYVAGFTTVTNFPTTPGAYLSTWPGGGNGRAGFITKLSPNGASLIYSTYLASPTTFAGVDELNGIAIDSSGNAYVTGATRETSFPTTAGSYKPTLGPGIQNAFVTKLNATGSALVYSTFLGIIVPVSNTDPLDKANAIAVDSSGNAYITGTTISQNFPVTTGAYQIFPSSVRDAFVTKLNANGTALIYSTYLGGDSSEIGTGIAVDSSGNAYVTGSTAIFNASDFPFTPNAFRPFGHNDADAFLTKLNPTGTALIYSTALGARGGGVTGLGVAVDSSGSAYVVGGEGIGATYSINPVQTSHNNDAFLLKMNPAGTGLAYSTPLGGSNGGAVGSSIALDATGNAYITGQTTASDFPTTSGAPQSTKPGGQSQTAFVAKMGIQANDCPAITINPQPLPAALLGQSYNQQLTATGGAAPYTFSLAPNFGANNLPPGLTLAPDGTLSGTTNNVGTYGITVQAIAANGCIGIRSFQFVVAERPAQLQVSVLGRGAILRGRENLYTFVYTNNGDVDAYIVPLFIRFPNYFIWKPDFKVLQPVQPADVPPFDYSQFPLDTPSGDQTIVSLLIPRIRAHGTGQISIKLTVPDRPEFANVEFTIQARMGLPFFDSFPTATEQSSLTSLTGGGAWSAKCGDSIHSMQSNNGSQSAISTECFQSLTNLLFDGLGLVPGANCGTRVQVFGANQGANFISTIVGAANGDSNAAALLPGVLGGAVVVAGQCVLGESPLGKAAGVISFAINAYNAFENCVPQGTEKKGRTVSSIDPNDKVGSSGFGAARYLTGDTPFPYIIYFENKASATAPAQEVVVTDQLDVSKFDLNTFSFGDVTIGNLRLSPLPNKSAFSKDFDLRPSNNIIARINANLDKTTGVITWRFQSIDPTTGQPTDDPLAGFLPPNTIAPRGEGSVMFTVELKPGLVTGAEARNKARIVFDTNAPIDTPEWLNTIDTSKPVSHVTPLGATQSVLTFPVQWSGTDTGSGISNYTIFVSENGGPFTIWLDKTTATSGTFSGEPGKIYAFYSVAQDQTGNQENNKTSGEATTTTPTWEAVVLTPGQTEIKTWIFQGRSYAYLKLLFPNAGYRVADWGQAVRAGNDFTADASVERFTGASVQAVTTTAQIYDLGTLPPGSYNFTFKNTGTVVKTLAFTVAAPPFPPNPIDDAREFVRQQYRDFLNREADQAGEDFWTDNITKCSDPARLPAGQTVEQCTLRQRETTSGAFFLSPEFQYTGYYVYRMYQGGLGRQPKLSEFTPDAQFVGAGILVNSQLSGAKINQNKADYAQQFVNCTDAAKYRCAEFKAIYDILNNQQYVDKLFQTTGVNASASDRAALVNGLNANPATETRASVLQKVVDGIVVISEGNQQFTTSYGQAFYNSEFNRAFVQLEYFGYMKRDPDDGGYAFWLGKLNQFGGDFVNAEMVLAFISSPEYRARFGQP